VRAGRFREDLFYRLNVFQIALPPLQDRADDIPLLVEHFIQKYASRHGKPVTAASPEAVDMLMGHDWPGNVRELEHTVERAVILCSDETILQFQLPEPLHTDSPQKPQGTLLPDEGTSIADALRAHERAMVIAALRSEKGIQARAARLLGVSRANLNYRIQKLGIVIKDIVYD
jgi:two-component system NtrC family response regulator